MKYDPWINKHLLEERQNLLRTLEVGIADNSEINGIKVEKDISLEIEGLLNIYRTIGEHGKVKEKKVNKCINMIDGFEIVNALEILDQEVDEYRKFIIKEFISRNENFIKKTLLINEINEINEINNIINEEKNNLSKLHDNEDFNSMIGHIMFFNKRYINKENSKPDFFSRKSIPESIRELLMKLKSTKSRIIRILSDNSIPSKLRINEEKLKDFVNSEYKRCKKNLRETHSTSLTNERASTVGVNNPLPNLMGADHLLGMYSKGRQESIQSSRTTGNPQEEDETYPTANTTATTTTMPNHNDNNNADADNDNEANGGNF